MFLFYTFKPLAAISARRTTNIVRYDINLKNGGGLTVDNASGMVKLVDCTVAGQILKWTGNGWSCSIEQYTDYCETKDFITPNTVAGWGDEWGYQSNNSRTLLDTGSIAHSFGRLKQISFRLIWNQDTTYPPREYIVAGGRAETKDTIVATIKQSAPAEGGGFCSVLPLEAMPVIIEINVAADSVFNVFGHTSQASGAIMPNGNVWLVQFADPWAARIKAGDTLTFSATYFGSE
jgi:hypothetical protein